MARRELLKFLTPGRVYRRMDLARRITGFDRKLGALVRDGHLRRISRGLYMVPRHTRFGAAPADAEEIVKAVLGGDRFLLVSPNSYNSLGVGATQLYNKRVVYNQKRHGVIQLDGRWYEFRRLSSLPKAVSVEFLLVDMLHNLDRLAEDRDVIAHHAVERAKNLDRKRLAKAVDVYNSFRVRRLLKPILQPTPP